MGFFLRRRTCCGDNMAALRAICVSALDLRVTLIVDHLLLRFAVTARKMTPRAPSVAVQKSAPFSQQVRHAEF
jgi:hypothetical protein